MKFIETIDEKRYKEFYKKNNGHFMQSYEWGQFNIIGRNQIPHYVGIEANNQIKCEALLLERKGPFGLSYFYCPRGFIIDFLDTKLLKQFTIYLKNFLKKHNAIYLRVDPEIVYHEIDNDGRAIVNGFNNYKLFDYMLKLGYRHTGFNLNFESNQPRFTFKIDLSSSIDDIKKNIHKSILKKIKKTDDYNMRFRESNDVETFYKLISKTSEKDNFVAYSYNYYKNACDVLGKSGIYKLFELYINPKELYNDVENKLKFCEEKIRDKNIKLGDVKTLEERKSRLLKEKGLLEDYKEYDELIICSQICALTDDTMWTLYIGNDEIGKDLFAVNRMYMEIINYAKETKRKYLDLFGTTGDVSNAVGNLAGIHRFKENFGGTYTEFIGEFDLINKKVLYKILPTFLLIYRKLIKIKK